MRLIALLATTLLAAPVAAQNLSWQRLVDNGYRCSAVEPGDR
jgi:hypothetical protein